MGQRRIDSIATIFVRMRAAAREAGRAGVIIPRSVAQTFPAHGFNMSSLFYRKIGSILGLLAILMTTLAPTVSQAIAASRGAYDPAAALCSAHTASPADTQEDDPGDTHTLASHWHACGYCSLLTHVPVLPTSPSTFALTVAAVAQRVATRFESVALIAPFEAAQPRAPPVSL